MLTYRATLQGDRLQWQGEVPESVRDGLKVAVLVTVLNESELQLQAQQRLEILEQLAANGGVQAIPNPLQWQHEQRRERQLPARDE